MADQRSLPDDDGIQWTKATSKNGVPFEFGVLKTNRLVESTDEENTGDKGEVLTATYPRHSVYWPVGDESTWIDLGPPVAVYITRYKLYRNTWSMWSWRLDVTVTGASGFTYSFTDKTGDTYDILIMVQGDHYVRYNSKQPTIVYVQR